MLQEFERIKYMHCSQEHINPVQDFGKLEVDCYALENVTMAHYILKYAQCYNLIMTLQ